MHMANDITGDFSMGATVVLDDGTPRVVRGATVAGNALRLLTDVRGVGDTVAWYPGTVATYGSPDLRVAGLTIGT